MSRGEPGQGHRGQGLVIQHHGLGALRSVRLSTTPRGEPHAPSGPPECEALGGSMWFRAGKGAPGWPLRTSEGLGRWGACGEGQASRARGAVRCG